MTIYEYRVEQSLSDKYHANYKVSILIATHTTIVSILSIVLIYLDRTFKHAFNSPCNKILGYLIPSSYNFAD